MKTIGMILLALPLVLLVVGMIWEILFPGPYRGNPWDGPFN